MLVTLYQLRDQLTITSVCEVARQIGYVAQTCSGIFCRSEWAKLQIKNLLATARASQTATFALTAGNRVLLTSTLAVFVPFAVRPRRYANLYLGIHRPAPIITAALCLIELEQIEIERGGIVQQQIWKEKMAEEGEFSPVSLPRSGSYLAAQFARALFGWIAQDCI